jgi:hypothetical protein
MKAVAEFSTGVRIEYRIDYLLFKEMEKLAEETDVSLKRLNKSLLSIWSIFSENYISFLLNNFEKLISTVEICNLINSKTGVTLERNKLITVFFKYLI